MAWPIWPFALVGLWLASSSDEDEDDDQDEDEDRGWEYEDEQTDPTPAADPQPYVPQPGISPLWPLPRSARKWRESSFASGRPWGSANPTGHHKGIDIRASEGDPVRAMDSGLVTGQTGWDGPKTRGLMVQHTGGPVLVYGAVSPEGMTAIGERVERGEVIAKVGSYPSGRSMLHLEVYRAGTRRRPRWKYDTPQPGSVVNPHKYLLATVTT